MPTYDYQCNKCKQTFEVFQSIKASPLRKAKCEHCGSTQSVRRLISSGGAVIFKGSGFYGTDYRSDSYKNAAKADTGSSASTAPASGDAKSDTAKEDSGKAGTTPSGGEKAKGESSPKPGEGKKKTPKKDG